MKIYFKPSFGLTVCTIPSFIILLLLGSWQIQRLSWKSDLISNYNINFGKNPISVEELFQNNEENKYRRVTIKGKYNHENEIQIIGKTYEGNAGYHIVTPFLLKNDDILYVNRGWVPKKYVDRDKRKFTLFKGDTNIIGLVRLPQKKGYFVPENEPDNGFWFTIIPDEFNSHLGISANSNYYIDELNIDGKLKLPMPANGKIQIPNNHLQYAITWYSLAIGLLIVYIAWHHQNGYFRIKK